MLEYQPLIDTLVALGPILGIWLITKSVFATIRAAEIVYDILQEQKQQKDIVKNVIKKVN